MTFAKLRAAIEARGPTVGGHDGTCMFRVDGVCNCGQSTILAALDELEREMILIKRAQKLGRNVDARDKLEFILGLTTRDVWVTW